MKYTLRPVSSRSGFTLIELLTVIAIIAILAGIVLPVIGKVRTTANNTRCSSNLREWGRAILLYSSEHKGTYTIHGINPATGEKYSGGWQDAGTNPYISYMAEVGSTTTTVMEFTRKYRGCPFNSKSGTSNSQADYAIVLPSINGTIGTTATSWSKIPLSLATNPAQLLLMVDAVNTLANSKTPFYVSGDKMTSLETYVLPMFDGYTPPTGYEETATRHKGVTINALFADNSIRPITATPAGEGDRRSILEMRTTWFQLN